MQFDQSVHGFSATIVRAAGAEVGQERLTPLGQGPAESGDLRDRAGRERVEDLLGDRTAGA